MQTGTATVESSTGIPQKIKNGTAFDPTSGTLSEEPQNANSKNISTPVFIAVLFTITKIWKQPKCPSVDEWIKQLWDIHTMEHYSAIKKDLVNIMVSEINSVRERQIPFGFTHMWNLMNKLN